MGNYGVISTHSALCVTEQAQVEGKGAPMLIWLWLYLAIVTTDERFKLKHITRLMQKQVSLVLFFLCFMLKFRHLLGFVFGCMLKQKPFSVYPQWASCSLLCVRKQQQKMLENNDESFSDSVEALYRLLFKMGFFSSIYSSSFARFSAWTFTHRQNASNSLSRRKTRSWGLNPLMTFHE